jgi:hypothetical protein
MTPRLTRTVRHRARLLAAVSAAALIVSGLVAGAASAETTWLCKPGLANNPCESNLTATVQLGNGSSFVEHAQPASNPPIDCFYVYPTVSGQTTPNSNLNVEPEETQVAIDQASRFSQVCKVYAPMYPQLTIDAELAEVGSGAFNPEQVATAYAGVLSAWHEYLAKYNRGRGVVLIGHSQGAGMLIHLMRQEISVPAGQVVGGDFQHIPACQAVLETHCVVAYSTFLQQPPADTLFGVVEGPVATLAGGAASGKNLQVLCVNPTLLLQGPGSGPLLQYESTTPVPGFLSSFWQAPKAPTPWVATPGQYSAQCEHANGDTWLQVNNVGPHGDPRELLAETLGPTFGLHLYDINLALGNLVPMVALQAQIYGLEHLL